MKCGNFDVEFVEEEDQISKDTILTTLRLQRSDGVGGSRTVHHVWFTGWPDHGVPSSTGPFLELIRAVHDIDQSSAPLTTSFSHANLASAFSAGSTTTSPSSTSSSPAPPPILVHCSAGIGRTGTFITVDAMLERIRLQMQNGVVPDLDVPSFINTLRRERSGMVQSLEQFQFCFVAIADELERHMSDFVAAASAAASAGSAPASSTTPRPHAGIAVNS